MSSKIKEISQSLKLPQWWVQSVAIEYLPCRKFCENGKLWIFDFDLINKDMFPDMALQKVVIPEYTLFQNISKEDFAYRVPQILSGQSNFTLENIHNLIPEGITNKTVFPYAPNPIDIWDPKLGFNNYSVVFDEGNFYQWKVAESVKLPSEKISWFKSDIFDLNPLLNLNKELFDCLNNIDKTDLVTKDKVSDLYEKLEQCRNPIRQKILEYHNLRKTNYKEGVKIHTAPFHSFFDKVKEEGDGYLIQTHLEPLFFRGAIRNLNLAIESRKKVNDPQIRFEAILDEMEYSMTCIILSVNCLESYINYIITSHLPDESDVFVEKQSTIRQKWLWVPSALDLPRFVITRPPYLHFTELIRWRNAATHYIPKYKKVKKYKSSEFANDVSESYFIFNVEHAKRSIEITKAMILHLSQGDKIPRPRWIDYAPNYH